MSQSQSIDTHDGDTLRDLRHVQARLNSSHSTIYELFATKKLRSVKIGRRRYVLESDLSAFISSLGDE